MWDDDALGIDERTKVFEKDPAPPSGPILLLQRTTPPTDVVGHVEMVDSGLPDDELLELVEIEDAPTRRPPPPPPRRRRLPPPPMQSLAEATPTRPGENGFSNELLFVEVTPPAFTLADLTSADDERSSVSLAPAAFDLTDEMPARPRTSLTLKIGAAAAVLMAVVSYLNGPIAKSAPVARASLLTRSANTLRLTAAPVAEVGEDDGTPATERRVRTRRAATKQPGPLETATTVAAAEEPVEEEVSEMAAKLTDALAPAFNVDAARASLAGAAGGASSCGDGTTSGTASVAVTFARSGRATVAIVGAPLSGTGVGSCVARMMRSASVPIYSGDIVTVRSTVTVP